MKREYIMIILTVILLELAWSTYADSGAGAYGDSDGDQRGWTFGGLFKRQPGVAVVQNARYIDECSSCHFAFPPGLLPEQSWRKIMANLDDHFDDNAEVDKEVGLEIEKYLVENSADKMGHRRSRKIMRSLGRNDTPMRITEMRYFRHEHDEIPNRVGKDNPKVRSLSNCDACHSRADQGSFREREINIPGFGRWDD